MHRVSLPFAFLFLATALPAQQPSSVFTNVEYWTCSEDRVDDLAAAIDTIWGPIFDEMTREGRFLDWHSQRPLRATRLNRDRDGLEPTAPPWQWAIVWSARSEAEFNAAWREMARRLVERFPHDPRPTLFCDDVTIVRYEGTPSPAPAPIHAALPGLTTDQRWSRAAQFADINFLVAVGFLKQRGLLDDFVEHMERVYPPTWRNARAPADLMRGMYRNYASYPNLEFEVLEVGDERVRYRSNRPWERMFQARGDEVYGARATDVERAMERVSRAIATHLGFHWEQRNEGDWTVVTITRASAGIR